MPRLQVALLFYINADTWKVFQVYFEFNTIFLQAIVEELNSPESDIDSEFRLWLSSKPDPSFPVPILQSGLKVI